LQKPDLFPFLYEYNELLNGDVALKGRYCSELGDY